MIMNWFRRLMYGRNGMDGLSNFLLIAGVTIYIVAAVFDFHWLSLMFFALVIWAYFRCFSKNVYQRRKENDAFMGFFRLRVRMFKERKTWRYVRCKQCKAYLRVPKHKGTLAVKCPKCHREYRVKT